VIDSTFPGQKMLRLQRESILNCPILSIQDALRHASLPADMKFDTVRRFAGHGDPSKA